jgi:6-phosphogluconate dehydrogenase
MKVGMIGLGRMGEGMSRRIIARSKRLMQESGENISVWGYRRNYEAACEAYENGYVSGVVTSIEQLTKVLSGEERSVYMLVVPAETVEDTLNELLPFCRRGDIIIDHGNSNFKESRRRAERLHDQYGIEYIDCGTSGGVYGMERGYCLMVGGRNSAVSYCSPIFNALAPDISTAPRTDYGSDITSAELGWLHCGEPGAGHFVKMVHNGIEYGIMQAYAEGFNILHNANLGSQYVREGDAEVAPMADPESYQYDIDVAEVAELWRRGSVVGSWLLDLTAAVLRRDGGLESFDGGVSDSGEGRWTVSAAVDLGVPAPVLSSALFARFESRRLGNFANRVLNGMRYMFGGHHVR